MVDHNKLFLPVNQYIIYDLEIESKPDNYWEINNPIIGRLKGAHALDTNTIRVGDGATHYRDLKPRAVFAPPMAGDLSVILATTDTPGGVPFLADPTDISQATGDGSVQAKHLQLVYDKMHSWFVTDSKISDNIGQRSWRPWSAPKPGFRLMYGQYILTTDPCYATMKKYMEENPYEVITPTVYANLLDASGGVGGVHYYALYPDGRIRLPDARGDFIQGSGGPEGLSSLEWCEDQAMPITGTITDVALSISGYNSGCLQYTAFQDQIVQTYTDSLHTWVPQGISLDSSIDTRTGSHNRPRGAAYLPVVYVGSGEDFVVDNGHIFLANVRNKHIGEEFKYQGRNDPPGGLYLNGRTISRETYKDLFNFVVANNKIKTELAWQQEFTANEGNVAFYSYSSNSSLFRIPTYNVNSRNWLTDSLLCVHAYHTIVEPGTLNYEQLVADVTAAVLSRI